MLFEDIVPSIEGCMSHILAYVREADEMKMGL